jgi:hypothetical protein
MFWTGLSLYTCVGLLWPVAIGAIDNKGDYSVRGIGTGKGSCGEYVRAKDVEVRRWYEMWLMGYITGVNSAKMGKYDYSNGIDSNGLAQWVENWCKQNPLKAYIDGIDAMLVEITNKK